MNRSHKRKYKILFFLGSLITLAFGSWWFEPINLPHNFTGAFHGIDIALFVLLSYVVWYQIVNELFSWVTAFSMKRPFHLTPPKKAKTAFLTAFVPGKEPYEVLEKTLKAMVNVSYKHDTWLLDEGNDEVAKELCKKYGVKHYTRKGSRRYNTKEGPYKVKTKGGNYNSWFHQYANNYDYVAQVDVDFIPKKNFLTKTLGYFKDPQVAFVGSPQIYGNVNESWIARGAAEQAYNFYGSMQKGFFGSDMQLFIGANHVIRVAAHNSVEGYAGHVVEDHLTGMKLYSKKWKSVYVPEILAIGEGPSTWDAYFSQQMRWAYGLIHILFTQSPIIFRKLKLRHIMNYFLLQQYYFFGLSQFIGIVLLTLYFLFNIQATSMNLIPLLLLYIPLIGMQQIIFLWLQRFNIEPETESGFMLRGKLLSVAAWPIYFLAFVSVLARKRITYKVTPKGDAQVKETNPMLFLPHFIFGSITACDILISFITGHQDFRLIFWAFINTAFMYTFVGMVVFEKIKNYFKDFMFYPLSILPAFRNSE